MSTQPEAVHFALTDYAPASRRFAAWLIDVVVIFGALSGLAVAVQSLVVPREVLAMPHTPERQRKINACFRPVQTPVMLGWVGFVFVYHTAGRKLRGGTLGYRVLRLRLVDPQGLTPPWPVLAKRFFLGMVTAGPLGASYLACRWNPRRQGVHDQWSGTWVIRKSANPVGAARITYNPMLVGLFLFTYRDLDPESEPRKNT